MAARFGKFTEILQPVRPDDVFASLRERGIKGTASCTIGFVLVYTDVFNAKVEHTTRFLVLYSRVRKTIERLSQYNEYSRSVCGAWPKPNEKDQWSKHKALMPPTPRKIDP
jgi:hypothetical protein